MKTKIWSAILPLVTAVFFLIGIKSDEYLLGEDQIPLRQTAASKTLSAGLKSWTDLHAEFLASAEQYAQGNMIAIPQFIEKAVVEKGLFEESLLFAPDAAMYYTTFISSDVFASLKSILGLAQYEKAVIDTATFTLTDGTYAKLSIILNSPSIGKGVKRKHYEDDLTLTRTLLDGSMQVLSMAKRNFIDNMEPSNDFKVYYTAKTMSGTVLSTAKIEGFVSVSNEAMLYKNEFTKYKYDANNVLVDKMTYSHSNTLAYTVSLANIAPFLGVTASRPDSLAILQGSVCATQPPPESNISVTVVRNDELVSIPRGGSIFIGETVTLKADFCNLDGVLGAGMLTFKVDGGEPEGKVAKGCELTGTVFVDPDTTPGSAVLVGVAFDAEPVTNENNPDELKPAGNVLATSSYHVKIENNVR